MSSSVEQHPRMIRERKTMAAMIRIFCRGNHGVVTLCADCRELEEYARARLAHCPFQEEKSTCANCTIHCYSRVMRERTKEVMRYSGPRMMYRHPILAIRHVIDGRRPASDLASIRRRRRS